MNAPILLFLLNISLFTLNAQSQTESILNDAKTFSEAYNQQDFDKYVDLMIPSVVHIAGGKNIMIDNIKEIYDLTTEGGFIIESTNFEEPEKFITVQNELHTILPQVTINKIGEVKFSKTSYLLAVSANGGKKWSFLDLEPYDNESIKIYVPTFTGELKIPEVAQPVILRE